jgi:hypothetical protein
MPALSAARLAADALDEIRPATAAGSMLVRAPHSTQ